MGIEHMRRLICLICICLGTLPAICQSASKYQVGTIIDVKTHQEIVDASSDVVRYDVSLKVADTIYLVLYTPPLGMNTVKYSVGRDLLVLVGNKTVTYNDLLGQSFEVPIISQRPAEKVVLAK